MEVGEQEKDEMKLLTIIPGTQTRVDCAALDVGPELGILIDDYCPKGRRAEVRTIPAKYPMIKTSSAVYRVRTEKKVIESDGTLIFNAEQVSNGTAYTIKMAQRHKKPFLVVQLDQLNPKAAEEIHVWLKTNQIKTLNVARPRESKIPGINGLSFEFLRKVFGGLDS